MRTTKPVSEVSGCGAIWQGRRIGKGVEMLMSFPSGIMPVEDVQNRMSRLIQHLVALVGVHREIEVCSVGEDGPTLRHEVHHHSFDLTNIVSCSVIWIDNLVGLEQAAVFIGSEVASDLRGQDIVVWISIGKLLHWLEVNLQNNRSMSGRRLPSGWSMKW